MPGCQDEFRINFPRGIFGINDQVLRENGKSHEFNSHHIAAARNAVQREFAFRVGDHRIFLAGQRVRGNHRRPGQRSFSAACGSANFVSGRCAALCRGRRGLLRRKVQANEQREQDQYGNAPKHKLQILLPSRLMGAANCFRERPLAHFLPVSPHFAHTAACVATARETRPRQLSERTHCLAKRRER